MLSKMLIKRLFNWKNLLFIVAIVAIIGVSYLYSQSQVNRVRQEDKLFFQAELVQNSSYAEIIKLNDSANKILTDCLNSSSCDRAKAANDINKINKQRDVINQEEEAAM